MPDDLESRIKALESEMSLLKNVAQTLLDIQERVEEFVAEHQQQRDAIRAEIEKDRDLQAPWDRFQVRKHDRARQRPG